MFEWILAALAALVVFVAGLAVGLAIRSRPEASRRRPVKPSPPTRRPVVRPPPPPPGPALRPGQILVLESGEGLLTPAQLQKLRRDWEGLHEARRSGWVEPQTMEV